MPWSNQGGGGRKSGGGGPWGQSPEGGGNGRQPDIEDMLKRSQDRIKDVLPGGGGSRGMFWVVTLLGLAALAFYGLTVRVGPDEKGIVTRFGKFDREVNPGLNFRLPPPIEEVYTPKVTVVNQLQVGYGRASDSSGETLMLTGDENMVDVDYTVFWRIKDPQAFLFNVRDGREFLATRQAETVKDVAESAIREVVGKNDITPILTQDRVKNEEAVRGNMQKILDSYKAGIEITQVQMQKVDPPGEVIGAFRDVQAAKTDFERAQNEAQSYANKVVPEARGDAQRIRQEAEAYREKIEAEAIGQADRFTKVYEAYKLAPDVTRKRIYLDTMQRVFSNMNKVIIDQKGGGGGVVPYLPLDSLEKRSTTTAGTN